VPIIQVHLQEFRSIWFGQTHRSGYNAPWFDVMRITALLLNPLGPALILGVGGLLIALSRRVIADPLPPAGADTSAQFQASLRRARLVLPLRVLFSILVALVALTLLLRERPSYATLTWNWQPLTVAGSALLWELDDWNGLASILILLLTLTALVVSEFSDDLLPGWAWPGREAERTLWLGAAALCFVCSGNVVTVASGWMVVDLALALRLRPGESEEPAGRAWSLLSLAGLLMLAALMLLGESSVRVTLASGPFTPVVLGLLWIAGLVRAGVYPLHFWLAGPGSTDAGGRVGLHLVGPLTGLWLLGRVNQAAGADWLRRPEWAALGALALFGTALAAWAVRDDKLRWRWVVLNRASLIVLAIYMVALAGAEVQVWLLTTFALSGGLLLVGMIMRRRWGWRWPVLLAALAVWGVPGTPGFLARLVLVLPTSLPGAVPLFGLILISEALLVAALWRLAMDFPARDGSAADPSPDSQLRVAIFGRLATVELWLALVLLALPLFYWGLFPQRLAALLHTPESGAFAPLLWTLANARRSVWIGLVLSGLGGLALGLLRDRIFSQMRGWQDNIMTVVSLNWLYRGIAGVLALAGSGLRYFSVLGEGEGYLGWLLLAGAMLWLLLRG
jgi:formate hydrogenlyase subunit 3/multisubunit Na+/H+ antiporter MnhD subunit